MTTTQEQAQVVSEDAPLQSLAAQVNAAHEHACASVRAGLDSAREAGSVLLEVKGRLRHGEFLPWVAAHTQLSARTAQGYMRLSRKWPLLAAGEDTQRVAHLSLRGALALLAEPEDAGDTSDMEEVAPLGEEARRNLPKPDTAEGWMVRLTAGAAFDEMSLLISASPAYRGTIALLDTPEARRRLRAIDARRAVA